MTESGPLDQAVFRALEVLPEEHRSPEVERNLRAYLESLLETNRRINLVSRRDTLAHVTRFVRECSYLARILVEDRGRLGRIRPLRLLDLGSGGGFPGLVLKIALPDVEMVLVEATRKKARFLAEVGRDLDLRRMTVVWSRAEDLSNRDSAMFRPDFRHHFDWVTAKGLGGLEHSTRLAVPFLEIEGVHWTFRGASCGDAIRSCERLFRRDRMKVLQIRRIPGEERSFVVGVRRLPPKKPARL
ncbi:MAG: 16S rRNA (guanine(527)-N(7))-methyltransferase RsmG [Candidatus Krumholzibacteriia bacterium]